MMNGNEGTKVSPASIHTKYTKAFLILVAAALYFAVLVIGLETVQNRDFNTAIVWASEKKFAFFFNFLIVYALFLIFIGLINRFFISFLLTNSILFFLVIMSYFKFNFLGENLYPWDLLLYNNVINLLPNLYQGINLMKLSLFSLLIFAIVSVAVAFIVIKKPKSLIKTNIWFRLCFLIVGLLIFSTFTFYRSLPSTNQIFGSSTGVLNQPWDQNRSYKENGFMVSFLFNMQSAIVLPPKGYSENRINEIVQSLKLENEVASTSSVEKPNIIIVMNEAFWDPSLLEKVEFTSDPMPTVRKNQNGWMLSPTFGGGTSNVEFEALTGMTNAFLPVGSVPYQQYLSHTVPALPSYLKKYDYHSVALHPYPKWFWNREEAYANMGFDKFIDIDGFTDPLYKGPYVADVQVSKSIIEQTEQSSNPVFLYAVTMQNHTSYSADRYADYTVEASSDLTPPMASILKTYTQGVADADEAFRQLTSYYAESEEPTVIVHFGDHLPTLGLEYEIYKQAGFLPGGDGEENWTLEDQQNMKKTPLAFWSNFGAKQPEINTISPAYIGPLALRMAGIESSGFHRFLDQFYNELPGYSREVKIDKNQQLYKVTPDESEKVKTEYELLQYDMMFGEQYAKQLFE